MGALYKYDRLKNTLDTPEIKAEKSAVVEHLVNIQHIKFEEASAVKWVNNYYEGSFYKQ